MPRSTSALTGSTTARACSRESGATKPRRAQRSSASDHLQRLHDSARLLYMELPYTIDELRDACHELIGVNGLPECYLRPIAFYGYGQLGVAATGNPVEVVIMSWPW